MEPTVAWVNMIVVKNKEGKKKKEAILEVTSICALTHLWWNPTSGPANLIGWGNMAAHDLAWGPMWPCRCFAPGKKERKKIGFCYFKGQRKNGGKKEREKERYSMRVTEWCGVFVNVCVCLPVRQTRKTDRQTDRQTDSLFACCMFVFSLATVWLWLL